MSILMWVLFGLVTGVVANWMDPRPSQGGILGMIVLGILGAVVGGFLANMLLGLNITGFNLTSIVISVLGSLTLLYFVRATRKVT